MLNSLKAAIRLLDAGGRQETSPTIALTLTAMTDDEQALPTQRLEATDLRGDWVRRLVLAATAIAILPLGLGRFVWAARLLNQAEAHG